MNNTINCNSSNEGLKELSFPNICISDEMRGVAPNLVIGAIFAEVEVEKQNQHLWNDLVRLGETIKVAVEDIVKLPDIEAIRQAYIKSGKEPSKYRGSAEALLRRVAQGKGLYQINNIVDINNFLSLKSTVPCGSYNIENIEGDIVIRIGKQGEQYKGIGKDMINIENLPLFADAKGPFGSPTSDSERAMITQNAKKVLIMLISFGGDKNGQLDAYLDEGIELLKKYAHPKNIQKKIIN